MLYRSVTRFRGHFKQAGPKRECWHWSAKHGSARRGAVNMPPSVARCTQPSVNTVDPVGRVGGKYCTDTKSRPLWALEAILASPTGNPDKCTLPTPRQGRVSKSPLPPKMSVPDAQIGSHCVTVPIKS
ncbi:hypothetical protein J6590_041969 [Homalodisca vitripennis]|nr:hypothetical protein J6590_041969 [Homalodisca vitripennis]